MKTMERKTFDFEVKDYDEEEGIIEGYGATFSEHPDAYGDIVIKGAFRKTIQENDNIVSLFNHNINEPIGKPELFEDERGLFTKIRLVKGVQRADEVLRLVKAGVIKKMSIGYETIKSEMVGDIRHLKEIKLYDVSPVVFPANLEAIILSAKNLTEKLDEIDKSQIYDISKVKSAITALTELLEPSDDTPPEPQPHSVSLTDLVNEKKLNRRIDEILKTLRS